VQLAFSGGIAHLERDPKLDRLASAGVAQIGNRVVKKHLGRGAGDWVQRETGVVRWAGVRSKYFLLAVVPKGAPDGEVIMTRVRGDESIATSLRLPLSVDGPTEYEFDLYAGPMQYRALQQFSPGLEKAMDLGWKFIVPFTRLLRAFFHAVHRVVPNYGLVIITLSAVVKLLFYPLTRKSMESMRHMQLLKPEMDKLNEKYKDDAQKRNQAVLEMYRKHKVNPLGGCLPIVVQMPVFIALYNVLNTSIELRKAPFALWVQDLSAPDRVGAVLGLPIHILPLVMAGTMIWQQKLTPTDPRQAAMAYMMPVIMTVFFYAMPSGLVLYWTVTNLMAVAQQLWMNKSIKQPPAVA
jgi:YidC/Oxa1 family membrane protein insertase